MARPKKYPDELIQRDPAGAGERPADRACRCGPRHGRRDAEKPRPSGQADSGQRPDLPTTAEREEIRKLRAENYELRRANEILKSAWVFFAKRARRGPIEVSRYIDERRGRFGVEPICRVLDMSASAYYHRATGSARRADRRRGLLGRSGGARRELLRLRLPQDVAGAARAGEDVGRGRVERLIELEGIPGAKRRGKPWRTTTHAAASAGRISSPATSRPSGPTS